jgi:hypothetical protein
MFPLAKCDSSALRTSSDGVLEELPGIAVPLLHQRDQALVAADLLVRNRTEAVHLELLDPRLLHVGTKVLVEVGVRHVTTP